MTRRIAIAFLFVFLGTGCASTRPADPARLGPDQTCFVPVRSFDFRPNAPGGPDSKAAFQAAILPGDLLCVYMSPGRAVRQRQWLFTVLPVGHSLVVLDPTDAERGLLEVRFRGAKRVGLAELDQYTRTDIHRLRDPWRLDYGRLAEFADRSCRRTTAYNFRSWVGANDNMRPERPEDISPRYTCSTYVAAAYHYAGLALSAADPADRVVTPLSLARSVGTWRTPSPTPAAPAPAPAVAAANQPVSPSNIGVDR